MATLTELLSDYSHASESSFNTLYEGKLDKATLNQIEGEGVVKTRKSGKGLNLVFTLKNGRVMPFCVQQDSLLGEGESVSAENIKVTVLEHKTDLDENGNHKKIVMCDLA